MNQINGKAWVDALRSGEYTQGFGELQQVDRQTGKCSYCCLGVANELAVAAGVINPIEDKNDFVNYFGISRWLGVEKEDPEFQIGGETITAIILNDKLKYTFGQIADLIETQYLTPQPTNSDESN